MPPYLQGHHEEANTLIALRVKNVTGNVIVRASDTDVLVIAALGKLRSDRDTLHVFSWIVESEIAEGSKVKPGLPSALSAYHALSDTTIHQLFT